MFSNFSDDFLLDCLQAVESDSFREWSALSGDNNVSFLNLEAWGNVDWDVSVSLLESIVLLHVMKVISSDDNCSFHFVGDDHSSEISAKFRT